MPAIATCTSTTTRARDWTARPSRRRSTVDAYVGLNERSRLFLLATSSRNRGEDLREGMVGVHADLFVKPLGRPWLANTPDAVKRHYMAFRVGYRYAWDMTGSSGYWKHRLLLEGTARYRPVHGFVFINRTRLDLRDVNGDWWYC